MFLQPLSVCVGVCVFLDMCVCEDVCEELIFFRLGVSRLPSNTMTDTRLMQTLTLKFWSGRS